MAPEDSIQDYLPFVETGFRILSSVQQDDEEKMNATFKNYDPSTTKTFISFVTGSKLKHLLNDPKHYDMV